MTDNMIRTRLLTLLILARNPILVIAITVLLLISTACDSTRQEQTIPDVTQSQFLTPPNDIRNYRYCEIIPVFRRGATFHVEVYNTINLNECPADLWNALDKEALVEAYGAADIKMNGPRYWVINAIAGDEETAAGKTVDFGGIEMILRATIETKLWEGTVGSKFYVENEVQRTTTYTYSASNKVYELTSPEGEVYRMQSYAQIVDPTLTIADLETLGERLDLPEGWSYQSRVLTEESKLIADGLAYVINDELGNSYQKVLNEVSRASSTIVPGPNDTGIYTTVTAFEHADAGRTHRFSDAVIGGDITNPTNNNVSVRTAPEAYPGAYNIVTRNPDELYIYFGVYGEIEEATGPTVALLNADTLEEVWRTTVKEFPPETWNYPGAIGLHGNGNLYAIGGNVIAALDPGTGNILKSTALPTANETNSSYNGFVTASDGTIFVKPLYRSCDTVGGKALLDCPDTETPSVLSAINPDTLNVTAQAEVSEPVFSRLSVGTHGNEDFVYMQGTTSLFRYRWNGTSLTLDEEWGTVRVLKEGQVGTASPSIADDWLFFQTNGLPSSTAPMTVWAISTKDSNVRYSMDPFADLTQDQSFNVSMGSYDPENSRVYVADTGIGYTAALAFDPATGFDVLWRKEQTTLAYTMLVNPKNQRVFVASNLTGLGSRVNPLLARNEQVVFRNAATGVELARTDKLARMNNGANLIAGYRGRFYFLGQDSNVHELVVY